MGKLDTVEVNGPEGDVVDWDAVDWRRVEDDVRRLRQRIFTATQAGDLKKVRNLQKLMLRSRANALCSVRRVTEINAGRKTAGWPGDVAGDPRWTGLGYGFSSNSVDAARSAASCCCTPRPSRNTPTTGHCGSQRPVRRSVTTRSSSTRGQSHWVTPHSVSSTRTASAACQTALPVRQHSAAPTDEPSGLA